MLLYPRYDEGSPPIEMSRPKRHPEEYADTDPHTMEVWLELLRNKTPGERMDAALQLSEFALRMNEAGVRAQYPEASEREIRLRAAARHLPRELMLAAYGWDPDDGHYI
jgi:hypothetical protein